MSGWGSAGHQRLRKQPANPAQTCAHARAAVYRWESPAGERSLQQPAKKGASPENRRQQTSRHALVMSSAGAMAAKQVRCRGDACGRDARYGHCEPAIPNRKSEVPGKEGWPSGVYLPADSERRLGRHRFLAPGQRLRSQMWKTMDPWRRRKLVRRTSAMGRGALQDGRQTPQHRRKSYPQIRERRACWFALTPVAWERQEPRG